MQTATLLLLAVTSLCFFSCGCAAQNRTLSAQNSTITAQNRTLPAQNSSLPTQNRTLSAQNSSLPTQNSTLPAQNRILSAPNSTLPAQNRTLPAQNRTLPAQNRTRPAQNRTLLAPAQNRTLPAQNNTILAPAQNRTLPAQNRTLSAQNTTLPTQNRTPSAQNEFTKRKNAIACVKTDFIIRPDNPMSERSCEKTCKRNRLCQGYKLPDPSKGIKCELYIFDRCSDDINRANCSDRGTIYVRNQPGVNPGFLCPDDFYNEANNLRFSSSRYILYGWTSWDVTSWRKGSEVCQKYPGLTKFADVLSPGEAAYMDIAKTRVRKSFFVGGYVTHDSTDNWQWQSCKLPLDPNVWAPGQPNGGGRFLGVQKKARSRGVEAVNSTQSGIAYALCECVDPFV